ncbi:ring-cleaving dioxygenase [Rhodohalobacter halophilus]|uniref:ring-cleaving dioxygenase n=1 Tax=Rhodohalobacter halophilus TaxID=1812810 RepID=UPI00083F7AAB|nr:ring-cleaving dioxygenase [Rhodohalobacter halophilus]
MAESIKGLHHITAVSGPPQENFNFYRNKLGLRFIKKTINFDDPFTYHLYYGNHHAEPGSAITFFPWQHVVDGQPNKGEATAVQYAVPGGSLEYWQKRFKKKGIETGEIYTRFGFEHLPLTDNDGMKIEIVADADVNDKETVGYGGVDDKHAIRGFFGTTLSLPDIGRTGELLTEMGWKSEGNEHGLSRYSSEPDSRLGRYVDLKAEPNLNGRFGRGSIHHIAFRVPDDKAQAEWSEKIRKMGFQVTPVKNRDYFRSIYFREAGGVLFEIATDIPGFDVDEPFEQLGESLKLPSWYEKHRDEIEARLPKLKTD